MSSTAAASSLVASPRIAPRRHLQPERTQPSARWRYLPNSPRATGNQSGSMTQLRSLMSRWRCRQTRICQNLSDFQVHSAFLTTLLSFPPTRAFSARSPRHATHLEQIVDFLSTFVGPCISLSAQMHRANRCTVGTQTSAFSLQLR